MMMMGDVDNKDDHGNDEDNNGHDGDGDDDVRI